jgi:hypothetical protein
MFSLNFYSWIERRNKEIYSRRRLTDDDRFFFFFAWTEREEANAFCLVLRLKKTIVSYQLDRH